MAVTLDAFCAVLRRHRLVDDGALSHLAQASDDPQVLADALVEQGLLTPWQAEHLLAGRQDLSIGSYRLLDKLGEGGMGAVFKAVHLVTRRVVAIKVMAAPLSAAVNTGVAQVASSSASSTFFAMPMVKMVAPAAMLSQRIR